jgi:phage head maturation protease
MRIQTTIGLAVAAGVMAGLSIGWRQHQRRQAARHQTRPAALPPPLQTWEDEGGAVPAPQG